MESSFDFDLVTPQAVFFSGQATMVEAPGTLGDFGVLKGHMNFISTLKAGIVAVHGAKEGTLLLFIAGGIAEVNNTSCTILAEHAEDLSALTREEAQARLAKAKAALAEAYDGDAKTAAVSDVQMAETIVAALT